jgi:hypothetical protein
MGYHIDGLIDKFPKMMAAMENKDYKEASIEIKYKDNKKKQLSLYYN